MSVGNSHLMCAHTYKHTHIADLCVRHLFINDLLSFSNCFVFFLRFPSFFEKKSAFVS